MTLPKYSPRTPQAGDIYKHPAGMQFVVTGIDNQGEYTKVQYRLVNGTRINSVALVTFDIAYSYVGRMTVDQAYKKDKYD